jgi:hypothetical protein
MNFSHAHAPSLDQRPNLFPDPSGNRPSPLSIRTNKLRGATSPVSAISITGNVNSRRDFTIVDVLTGFEGERRGVEDWFGTVCGCTAEHPGKGSVGLGGLALVRLNRNVRVVREDVTGDRSAGDG